MKKEKTLKGKSGKKGKGNSKGPSYVYLNEITRERVQRANQSAIDDLAKIFNPIDDESKALCEEAAAILLIGACAAGVNPSDMNSRGYDKRYVAQDFTGATSLIPGDYASVSEFASSSREALKDLM